MTTTMMTRILLKKRNQQIHLMKMKVRSFAKTILLGREMNVKKIIALNLQISIHGFLSKVDLVLKVYREKVPKNGGVVNHASYRRGIRFYASNVQISSRSVWCPNSIQIDPILSI